MKKKFETPKLTIINFADEDIIVTSSEGGMGLGYGEQGGDEGSGNYNG